MIYFSRKEDSHYENSPRNKRWLMFDEGYRIFFRPITLVFGGS